MVIGGDKNENSMFASDVDIGEDVNQDIIMELDEEDHPDVAKNSEIQPAQQLAKITEVSAPSQNYEVVKGGPSFLESFKSGGTSSENMGAQRLTANYLRPFSAMVHNKRPNNNSSNQGQLSQDTIPESESDQPSERNIVNIKTLKNVLRPKTSKMTSF